MSSPLLTFVISFGFALALLLLWPVAGVQGDAGSEPAVQCLGDVCDGNLIVKLANGVLRGKDNGFYYSYETIPYAKPPVGELRLEPPQPYTKKWKGILDASKPPPKCIQYNQFNAGEDKVEGIEDCLTVSIYRPKFVDEALPVVVFFHGGAFMFGGVTDNDQTPLMKTGRCLVVKVNYRLGPLGFLSTEDDVISGNFGLKDQRLALQWVQKNIVHFGGDASRVLITGFSAGGASVHYQLLQPRAEKLFKAAFSFSGTAFSPWAFIYKAREKAFKLAEVVGCKAFKTSLDIKKCLKKRSAAEIVGSVKEFLVFGFNPFTTFGPSLEHASVKGAFLTKAPEHIIKSGEFTHIPWVAGYTKEDGAYNAAELVSKDPLTNRELIEELNANWEQWLPEALFFKDAKSSQEEVLAYARQLKAKYLGEGEFTVENFPKVLALYTDQLFKNGVEKAVQLHGQYGSSPVYAYVYDNPADRGVGTLLAQRSDIPFGTGHGDDFFLVFSSTARNAQLRQDEESNQENFLQMIDDLLNSSESLLFGSCEFVDNTNKEELQLMVIRRDSCENKSLAQFP